MLMDGILRWGGLVIRAIQFILAVTIMGIAGYLVQDKHHRDYSTSYGYNLFVSVWTVLLIVYLVVTAIWLDVTSRAHRYVTLALEFLTWVFWLAAWASLANNLSGSCRGYTPCERVEGGIGVGVVEWVLWSITLAAAIMSLMKDTTPVGSRNTIMRSRV